MNKRIKKKWLAALRSGEYVQGRNQLLSVDEDGDSFCCLGVLCELHAQETGVAWSETRGYGLFRYHANDVTLPSEVKRWAGLEKVGGSKMRQDRNIPWRTTDADIDESAVDILADANDGGATFKQIARWIEKYL